MTGASVLMCVSTESVNIQFNSTIASVMLLLYVKLFSEQVVIFE